MNLILASKSPYKRNQLTTLGLAFDCCNPEVKEDHTAETDIEKLAMQLSYTKARAALSKHPDHLIIGSDQTAIDPNGTLLTKPGTFDKAKLQLQNSNASEVRFFSAVTLLSSSISETWSVTTTVTFRELSEPEIERYLKKDQPYDCAGSFKVESLGISLFESVKSNDPSALVGLPLISLSKKLRALGFAAP